MSRRRGGGDTEPPPQMADLLARHGRATTAYQTLEAGLTYAVDGDACTAYARTCGGDVAAGEPLAAAAEVGAAAARFVARARAQRRRACFFAVEAPFVAACPALRAWPIGLQPVWDPSAWVAAVPDARGLRRQLARARAHGVEVRAGASVAEAAPAAPLAQLLDRWQRSRAMAPLQFLARLDLTGGDAVWPQRRAWAAWRGATLVGLLAAVPVPARRGWLLEDVLRDPGAPNGTAELLLDAAMRDVAAAGAAHVTLGLTPLCGPLPPLLRLGRALGRGLYGFAGLHAFRAKLRPQAWEPVYLCAPEGQSLPATLIDVLRAFAPGGLTRFALTTALRGPPLLLHAVSLMLLPWTAALAAVDGATWFGHVGLQRFWVAFDIVLLAALWRLGRRFSARLAGVLAWAVSLDAAATLAEVLAVPVPPHRGATAARIAAVLGPTLAAVVLHGSRRRLPVAARPPAARPPPYATLR